MPTTTAAYPPEYFDRVDESDDTLFYTYPRKVVHIDDAAIATLSDLFAELLPSDPNAHYLDLMSSWRTHLPDSLERGEVIGLGMNADEMADNPQLTSFDIQNLNADHLLPYGGQQFDAAMCTVSVQYLIRPLEVFKEVNRVLKPGGVFIVSFSNRCFPSKAIKAWVHSGDEDHIGLVNSYFQLSENWSDGTARIKNMPDSDPLFMLWAYKSENRPQSFG